MDQSSNHIHVLLVEDNPADIRLTQEALRESKIYTSLDIARDGEEAMKILLREGQYADARQPDVILLDLNLPKKDGREVLADIKDHPRLKHIPVVILTSSQAEEDILRTYNLHANCYINKPVDFHQFIKVVRSIESFWFTVVKLPPREDE